jgi:stalled ribosome rescue protein Dom34
MPKRGRRGYPTAILIGLDKNTTNIWLVYNESIKKGGIIPLARDDKGGYKHNEAIIQAVRDLLPDGFNQLIVASPEKSRLVDHINRSHGWLAKRVTIKELQEKAITSSDVIQLVKSNRIQESVEEGAGEINQKIIDRLEKALNTGDVLFTLQELAEAMRAEKTAEFILVSEKFDAAWRTDHRYQSLIQRAKNMRATFTIVKRDAPGYTRIEQLGGFVCVIRP